ncbi:radical SAM/Cys-rich protein [Synechococcus sp. Ace-Pa]|nr:radical SAM/Cys-rich protein [Synechococcus sp. Ace-Pa]
MSLPASTPTISTPTGTDLGTSPGFPSLRRLDLRTLQVNITYRCNQACSHCHVDASPSRTESMDDATLALIPSVLQARGLGCLDLTGGAPELHPGFRGLVRAARRLGVQVIDRCNLTILLEPGQEDLAAFLAAEGVTVVASLPCYLKENVEKQRGGGVFARSIEGLRRLNALGYGQPDSGLELDLVYNPQGAALPPPQQALEADYRRVLWQEYGVVFNRLYALANMPIQRFSAALAASGQLDDYLALLRASHRPANLDQVMCRQLISVDWQGWLYDCDFNQQLGLPAGGRHLRDLLQRDPAGDPIQVAAHCFGCTAGSGSSCGGALAA